MNNKIRKIYVNLCEVISLYTESNAFNDETPALEILNSDSSEGNPYLSLLEKVDNQVLKEFLFESDDVIKRLKQIISETREFVESCEMPGVPDRWIDINENLRFFDAAFEVLESSPEMLEKIVTGEVPFHLGVLPREGEIEKRKEYFSNKKLILNEMGRRGDEREIFQMELLETLRLVFRNDFREFSQ